MAYCKNTMNRAEKTMQSNESEIELFTCFKKRYKINLRFKI